MGAEQAAPQSIAEAPQTNDLAQSAVDHSIPGAEPDVVAQFSDAHQFESSERQAEVQQLDERIATLQFNEQAQYATISSLESSLDTKHAYLHSLEARVAELEAGGSSLENLREMSQKHVEIAKILRQLISDNQGQAEARAKIIESQRQQLTARNRRNLLKQAEGDEVAARLLATRRETMRLRSKIKELKQHHAQLQEMKGLQQEQLMALAESLESHTLEANSIDVEMMEDCSTNSSTVSQPDSRTSDVSSSESGTSHALDFESVPTCS